MADNQCGPSVSVLAEELAYFREHKDEWLQRHKGKFALVKGRELIGTFTTDQQAYEAGVKKFGREAFLIKEIVEEERIEDLPALTSGLIDARL
jgi:hypothetical protein